MILRIADFFHNLRKEEKGFTLIELIIVIAILGVIAGIAVPTIVGRVEAARVAADEANVRIIEDAARLYRIDTGGFPTDLDTLVTKGYLVEVPADPWGRDGEDYTIDEDTGRVTPLGPPE